MLPDLARLLRVAFVFALLAAVTALVVRSLGNQPTVAKVQSRLDAAEAERNAVAVRVAPVVAHAAKARAAANPALARAESLHSQMRVAHIRQLVPPLVSERIQADSLAISALSTALMLDTQAAAAQQEQLVSEAKVSDAARLTIASLEHERAPRCGRRCGMVLGAASAIALGMAFR